MTEDNQPDTVEPETPAADPPEVAAPGADESAGAPGATGLPDPPTGKAKLSKADRLQARAERLREQEARRAAQPPRAGRGNGWVIATVVLSIVSAALLALSLVFVVLWRDRREVDDARSAAVKAARTWAVAFGSYDYRDLNADFARTSRYMTPSFAKSYQRTSSALADTFEAYQTKVTASVPHAAAESASTSTVVVLVLLDQVITSKESTTPKINRNRLEVTMVHRGGRWLVDKTVAT